MFDGPIPYDWRPQRPKPMGSVRVPMAIFALLAGLFFYLGRSPMVTVSTFSAPGGMRQIEALEISPSEVDFYLHDAGYRLRHKRQLLAVVYGAPSWGVTWQGADAVTIQVPEGYLNVIQDKVNDLKLKVSK